VTAYLRKLKTKLQFNNQNYNHEGAVLHTNTIHQTKVVLTHSQWAHVILGSIIIGTILGYGNYFPVLNQMHYIFAIGIAIIGVGVFKALQSANWWSSLGKLIVFVSLLIGLSYYQTNLRIIHFNSYTSYYLHQEGEYLGTVVIAPERVNLNGHEYYKYTIEIHSLHPYKDTAKNDYINAMLTANQSLDKSLVLSSFENIQRTFPVTLFISLFIYSLALLQYTLSMLSREYIIIPTFPKLSRIMISTKTGYIYITITLVYLIVESMMGANSYNFWYILLQNLTNILSLIFVLNGLFTAFFFIEQKGDSPVTKVLAVFGIIIFSSIFTKY